GGMRRPALQRRAGRGRKRRGRRFRAGHAGSAAEARQPHRHHRRLQPVRQLPGDLEAGRRLFRRERPASRRTSGGVLMLRIWGRGNSVNVKKALWALEELGLKYGRINAGMEHGVSKTPEYLKMNP